MAIKYTKSGRIDERTAEGKAEMDISRAQERRVSLAEDLVQQRKELNKEMEKSNSFMNCVAKFDEILYYPILLN